jgi:Bacterial SH3 domain
MIICNQCGNSLADGHNFCTQCGNTMPISRAPASPTAMPTLALPQSPVTSHQDAGQAATRQSPSKANPLPWLIMSVVIALAAIIVIYNNSKSGPNSSATSYNSSPSTTSYNQGRVDSGSVNTYRTPSMTPSSTSSNMRPNTSNMNINTSSQSRTLAYCNANSLNIRSSPVLDMSKTNQVGELRRGDQVWIIRESSNYDTYNGVTSNWAEVQTVNGSLHGWVFRYYLEIVEGED